MSPSDPSSSREPSDPALVHARREALVILAAFGVFLVWSVSFCYLAGYPETAASSLSQVFGMPKWVFWGVFVPWLAADLFALWFCFGFMADDPLQEGEAEDDPRTVGSADREPGEEDRHA